MATSGLTIAQITRDEIITDALGHLVVLGEGQSPNAAQITKGTRLLNNIVSEFRTFGMQVWARTNLDIPLVVGQDTYVIGTGQAINTPYPTYIYDIELQMPTQGNKFQMTSLPITDFEQLPLNSTGTPVNYNYQPQVNLGTLVVWPTPDSSVPVGTLMNVTYQRPIEIFNAATDTPDFPQEWGNALTFSLALVWADTYGVPEAKKAWLEKQAEKHLNTVLGTANEQGSMFIQPYYVGGNWES